MENQEIKERLKEIENIVADLQEPVKTIATKELVAKLLGTKQTTVNIPTTKTRNIPQRNFKENSNTGNTIEDDEKKDKEMIEKINRTSHEAIHKLKRNIDRALYVLKIMKDEGYDGLNPSQITTILSNVFRINSNLPAISMALINDKYYTAKSSTTYKGSKANVYRIMQAGINYIQKTISEISNLQKEDIQEEKKNEE